MRPPALPSKKSCIQDPVWELPAEGRGERALVSDGLTKVFHDKHRGVVEAARSISFDCRYGEIFGFLGPNGAGKTTTLRMLATILQPTAGTARVAGWDIVKHPLEVRRKIGYLSGNTGLYRRLTVRETLEYFGRLHRMPEERLQCRIEEVFELFDMRAFSDTLCEKLSAGMRQKACIARTILHDPDVLILDEPTLGLDILVASTMVQFIRECRERGKCILFSTHIMSEVEKLCDRVGIIHKGMLRAIGTLNELRDQTGCRYLEDIFLAVLCQVPEKGRARK